MARFWTKVSPIPFPTFGVTGCWIWTGATTSKGYGSFNLGKDASKKQVTGMAHKLTYEAVHGSIAYADGLVIDHLCRNRACCNPAHLEAVPEPINVSRGISPSALNEKKLTCPRGHAYSSENTTLYRNKRYCKTCRRKPHVRSKELFAA